MSNGSVPVWQSVTNAATGQASITGNVFVPKTPELFYYDADGNLTNDGCWRYTWDAENRLVSLTTNTAVGPRQSIKFEYDWQGRRIRKQVWSNASWNGTPTNDVKFVYDGWNLLAELNATNNNVIRSFMWGLTSPASPQGAGGVGGLLEVVYKGAQTTNCFVAFDGNGNVAALADAGSTNILAQYEYGPFGEVLRATGPMAKANPFRFSTKYQDDETDLLYYGYRYYSASIGRWLSRDPLGERGGKNLLAFVRNNGVCLSDARGLSLWGWACCNDECPYAGAVSKVKLKEYRLTANSRGPEHDALYTSTAAEHLDTLSQAAAEVGAAIASGWSLAVASALAEQLDLPTTVIYDLYSFIIKHAQGVFSGFNLYTRVEYQRCQSKSCRIFWSRLDWTEKKSTWRKCTIGSVNPFLTDPNDYNYGLYQDFGSALANVSACAQAHVDEITSEGATHAPAQSE